MLDVGRIREEEIDRREATRVVGNRDDALQAEVRGDGLHVADLLVVAIGVAVGLVRRSEAEEVERDHVAARPREDVSERIVDMKIVRVPMQQHEGRTVADVLPRMQ